MKTMKRILLLLLLAIVFCLQSKSQNISQQVAALAAKNFLDNYFQIRDENKNLIVSNITANKYNGVVCYYVVCFEGGGYVKIASTNASVPVLSFSEQGTYSQDHFILPPAYIEWMDNYNHEIYNIIVNNLDNGLTLPYWDYLLNKEFGNELTIVGPLITSRWGQNMTNDGYCEGYNNLMPL